MAHTKVSSSKATTKINCMRILKHHSNKKEESVMIETAKISKLHWPSRKGLGVFTILVKPLTDSPMKIYLLVSVR